MPCFIRLKEENGRVFDASIFMSIKWNIHVGTSKLLRKEEHRRHRAVIVEETAKTQEYRVQFSSCSLDSVG